MGFEGEQSHLSSLFAYLGGTREDYLVRIFQGQEGQQANYSPGNSLGDEETALTASREDTSLPGALASCQQCQLEALGSALASDRHKRWAEGGNRTGMLGVEAEHRNHRTRRTAGYGALEDTSPVARHSDTTPVIRHCLREAEKLVTDGVKDKFARCILG